MTVRGGLSPGLQDTRELTCYYWYLKLKTLMYQKSFVRFKKKKEMVTRAKAWKGKLKLRSLVRNRVLPFTSYTAGSVASLPPKNPGCSLQNPFHVDNILSSFPSPGACVSRSSGSVRVVLQPGGWWAPLFQPWKCWGSFQPRWPSCWFCLRIVLFCSSLTLTHLIQDISEAVWCEATTTKNNEVELLIIN